MFALLPLDTVDTTNSSGAGLIGFIIVLSLVVIQVVLFISALVSILSSRRYTGGGKFLWLVVVFFAPFLGPVGWFVGGRTAQIRTSVE